MQDHGHVATVLTGCRLHHRELAHLVGDAVQDLVIFRAEPRLGLGAAGVFKSVPDTGAGPDTYVFTDQNGDELTFFAFDNDSGVAKGQLWKIADPAGNVAYVGDSTTATTAISNGYDAGGRILKAYDSADRRFTYTYTTLDSVVRLTQVKAETKTSGTWASPSGVATVLGWRKVVPL